MTALHSKKVEEEIRVFVDELYSRLPNKDKLFGSPVVKRVHQIFLPIYIMRHFCDSKFASDYLDTIVTNLIECECLLLLGFNSSGMTSLRSAIESAFKFLYYEYHPIENIQHSSGNHSLSSYMYREFLYLYPNSKSIPFIDKDYVEGLWSDLCKFVHCDISVKENLTVVADITSIIERKEDSISHTLNLIKRSLKTILCILFAVNPAWAEKIEKTYFDAIFELYSVEESKVIKEMLGVS